MPNLSTAPSDDVLDQIKAILGHGGWKAGAEAISYFDDPRAVSYTHLTLPTKA